MGHRDDLWAGMAQALRHGREFVLATVVSTSSSAPRPVGTQMAIVDDGSVVGSLSGGCIEADVYARAEDVATTGDPCLQDYAYSDETASGVGLTCGGSLRVLLERVADRDLGFYRSLAAHVQSGSPVAAVTALTGPCTGRRTAVHPQGEHQPESSPPDPPTHRTTRAPELQAREMLHQHTSGIVTVQNAAGAEPTTYFVRSYGSPAHLVVFGSNAFAAALVRLAKVVGYYVTVCDARATFTTRERFPEADQLVVQWPHRYLDELEVDHRTVLCAMTHDPKFDVPLLEAALRSSAQFVGAMGSRQTTADRYHRLRAAGLDEEELSRLHAPFGLDLGGSTPEEAAVSMMAEIISARQSGSNQPLRRSTGPIHRLVQS